MSNLLEKASIITTPTAYSDGFLHSVKPEQTLGSELLTNGDFATDSDWTLNTGWSISDGKLRASNVANENAVQNQVFIQGVTYKITYTISDYVKGEVRARLVGGGGGGNLTLNSSNGTFTEYVVSNENHTSFRIRGENTDGGFTGSIDNVSVKEVTNADFTFTRNNIGTRVNASGNIESIAGDLPRIDYLGGSGSWLLEPEATNTATDSNDFTTGQIFEGSSDPTIASAILTSAQATSPDGTNNAWKLVDNNDGNFGATYISYFTTDVIANNYNTVSLFAKKQGNNDWLSVSAGGFDSSAVGNNWFDIANGTLGNVSSNHTVSIDDYGNGWYRCSITFQATTDTRGSVQIKLATNNGQGSITRDGTNGVYMYGIQAESHATRQYATSYIPTSGGTVTRGADLAIDAGSSDLINSTEGVFYAELKNIAEYIDVQSSISINDSSINNRLMIYKAASSNKLRFQIRKPSGNINFNSATTNVDFDKVAIKWKSGDNAVWVNGVEVFTDTSSGTTIGLNNIDFSADDISNPFQGNVKCVAVFKEALTDAELTCLTTI